MVVSNTVKVKSYQTLSLSLVQNLLRDCLQNYLIKFLLFSNGWIRSIQYGDL